MIFVTEPQINNLYVQKVDGYWKMLHQPSLQVLSSMIIIEIGQKEVKEQFKIIWMNATKGQKLIL